MLIEALITIKKSDYDNLLALVASLQEEIRLLKNGKNSKSSHTSPSHDLQRSNSKSLRPKGVNKTGGQPGHEGKTLQMSPTPDKIIDYDEINFCQTCATNIENVPASLFESKQEVVIPPIAVQYIEHRSYQKKCNCCGLMNYSKLPSYLSSNIQYSPAIESMVAYFHAYQFLPVKRMVGLFNDVFNLPISEGTIDNMLTRFAIRATPIYEQIHHRVGQSKVVGADETGSKVANKKGWFHTWQTTALTFIAASMNRGYDTVLKYYKEGFKHATLVSDCWASQLKTKANHHQLCIVHLLRELVNFIDAFENDNWSVKLKLLFEQSIEIKKLSKINGLLIYHREIETIKETFRHLLDVDETGKHKKLAAFIRRLRKNSDSVFVFLNDYEVPFDNNASERAIRMIKVKTKVSGCFRTFDGAVRFAKIRSVIDTTIKNQGNTLEALNLLAYYRAE